MSLYPLKFRPRLFHKIWGGQHLKQWYDHVPADYENVGESWVMSAVSQYPTEVSNGHLAGDELTDLLEVYMDELVGGAVYDVFENTFPLLIKFIDAADDLSIQVHPNDEQAAEMEQSLGKTEMWYIMASDKDASIISGWTQSMDEQRVRQAIQDGTLSDYLRTYPVQAGDSIVVEAGMVHALRHGTLLAEIQENSDITYRLYDYNRVGNDGKHRPLHLDKALQVVNYDSTEATIVHQSDGPIASNLASTPYFTTNVLHLQQPIRRDYAPLDSFVVYVCVEGECRVEATEVDDAAEAGVSLRVGEAVLLPACLNDISLTPAPAGCRLLEVYIDL